MEKLNAAANKLGRAIEKETKSKELRRKKRARVIKKNAGERVRSLREKLHEAKADIAKFKAAEAQAKTKLAAAQKESLRLQLPVNSRIIPYNAPTLRPYIIIGQTCLLSVGFGAQVQAAPIQGRSVQSPWL